MENKDIGVQIDINLCRLMDNLSRVKDYGQTSKIVMDAIDELLTYFYERIGPIQG